jgi:hypothetical protein
MGKTLAILLLLCGAARAEESKTPQLDAERDQLIPKIIDGKDLDASIKRFGELIKQRDQVIATSEAAREAERKRHEQERAERDALQKLRESYTTGADYDVAHRCTLSPDPAHPVPSKEGYFKGDWGKVTRKEAIKFPPKNALDDGEPATMYEIAGQAQPYILLGEKAGRDRKYPFTAEVGDLVMFCGHPGRGEQDKRLPPQWGEYVHHGFAVRLAAVPRIVQKARWAPIHIGAASMFWIVHDVKWKYPPDGFLLFNFEIDEDLGGGRYRVEIDRQRDMFWQMVVPPAVARRGPKLQKGMRVWAILGHPVFDKNLKSLVLTAEDLEEHYITEK